MKANGLRTCNTILAKEHTKDDIKIHHNTKSSHALLPHKAHKLVVIEDIDKKSARVEKPFQPFTQVRSNITLCAFMS